MLVSRSSPFGSKTRTLLLVALRLLSESHAREMARLVDLSLYGVQQALRSLERDGLVAARIVGRVRLYRLSPAYFAREEVARYLDRLAAPELPLKRRVESLRRRPRRSGKPI